MRGGGGGGGCAVLDAGEEVVENVVGFGHCGDVGVWGGGGDGGDLYILLLMSVSVEIRFG